MRYLLQDANVCCQGMAVIAILKLEPLEILTLNWTREPKAATREGSMAVSDTVTVNQLAI